MRLIKKISQWMRRCESDAALDAEIQAHLAFETEQRIERGEGPREAYSNARKDLGSTALVKEQTRDAAGGGVPVQVLRDWGYAARSLRKSPGFTTTAVVTAAIGLGAVTTMYTLVHALVLRPLPAPNPQELLLVSRSSPATPIGGVSVPMYQEIAKDSPVFHKSFLWFGGGVNNLSLNGTPRLGTVDGVLGDYYGTMGVQPVIGRGLSADDLGDGGTGAKAVAVISDAVWQKYYGGSGDVLGKSIRIEETDFTIIGVHPPNFPGVYVDIQADAVVPLTRLFSSPEKAMDRRFLYHSMVLRRNTNQSETAVQAYLESRWPTLLQEYRPEQQTEAETKDYDSSRIGVESFATGMSFVRRRLQSHIEGLLGAAVLLLALICVNIGNLVMSRASARVREHALRLALGASRLRLIHLVMAECLLIGAASGLAALLVSIGLTRVMAGYVWAGFVDLAVNLYPDFTVLAFLVAVTMATTVFFGLLPALTATRADAAEALRERSRVGVGGRRLWSGGLLATQMALSIALLAGATSFWQSMLEGARLSESLASKPIYSSQLFPLPGKQWNTPEAAYYEELRGALLDVPGIDEVSLSNAFQLQRSDTTTEVAVLTGPLAGREGSSSLEFVAPHFLDALEIPLQSGRDFRATDTDATPKVAMVSATLARDYFAGEAVGHRIRAGRDARAAEAEIIGVFTDTNIQNPRTADPYLVLLPTYQTPAARRQPRLLIRSPLDQRAVEPAIAAALDKLGRHYSLSTRSIRHQQRDALREERMMLEVSGAAAGFALFLSCLGLYSLLSYQVAQKTPEIGLRAALGATRRRTIQWLAARSSRVLLPGIIVGALAAWWALRWSAHLLEGFTATPFLSIVLACLALLAASVLATAIPAVRASRIDPATALRHD